MQLRSSTLLVTIPYHQFTQFTHISTVNTSIVVHCLQTVLNKKEKNCDQWSQLMSYHDNIIWIPLQSHFAHFHYHIKWQRVATSKATYRQLAVRYRNPPVPFVTLTVAQVSQLTFRGHWDSNPLAFKLVYASHFCDNGSVDMLHLKQHLLNIM